MLSRDTIAQMWDESVKKAEQIEKQFAQMLQDAGVRHSLPHPLYLPDFMCNCVIFVSNLETSLEMSRVVFFCVNLVVFVVVVVFLDC